MSAILNYATTSALALKFPCKFYKNFFDKNKIPIKIYAAIHKQQKSGILNFVYGQGD